LTEGGLERVEAHAKQAHRRVQVILELARNVRVEGIEHRYVDPPRPRILAHRESTEALAQAVGKGRHEIDLRTDHFQRRNLRPGELTVQDVEELGALRR
jgi:hypothetical protein